MMELVFCTSNQHKLNEVSQIMGDAFLFKTLTDIGYHKEIPEPFNTLEENSFTKANQVYQETGRNCFAEDTGLFISALDNEPGVYSARYAGEPSNAKKNIDKVITQLIEVQNRAAYFKTVITLIIKGKSTQFAGLCHGTISKQISGTEGFGYDSIFIPENEVRSFAELSAAEKNAISHRKKAFDQLAQYLKTFI